MKTSDYKGIYGGKTWSGYLLSFYLESGKCFSVLHGGGNKFFVSNIGEYSVEKETLTSKIRPWFGKNINTIVSKITFKDKIVTDDKNTSIQYFLTSEIPDCFKDGITEFKEEYIPIFQRFLGDPAPQKAAVEDVLRKEKEQEERKRKEQEEKTKKLEEAITNLAPTDATGNKVSEYTLFLLVLNKEVYVEELNDSGFKYSYEVLSFLGIDSKGNVKAYDIEAEDWSIILEKLSKKIKYIKYLVINNTWYDKSKVMPSLEYFYKDTTLVTATYEVPFDTPYMNVLTDMGYRFNGLNSEFFNNNHAKNLGHLRSLLIGSADFFNSKLK